MTTRPIPVVLVVDDDADARLIMRAALRHAGYEVREATGGHDALQHFRDGPCDMVMLDVDMPDLDGHRVCAAMRADAGALLPIVMVTGMDDLASVEAAYDAGATDFIAKPVNWALFGHRVRYLFRSYRAMLDLQAAESRHAALLEAIPDLLFELDLDGRYLDFRAPRTDLLAAPPEALLGRRLTEVLPPQAAAVTMAALLQAHREGSSSGAQFELPLAGRTSWFELSVSRKAVAPGETPRFIVLSRDVTDRKRAEEHIARMAYFDSLTGLANRRSFYERVDREIARAQHDDRRIAVLFMDLDGFKDINDSMGHAAGDALLKQVAGRLRDSLRPSDLLSRPMDLDAGGQRELARLGGDEFTALLCDLADREDALKVAHRIGRLMRQPFRVEANEVNLSASIGIAFYPEDGGDAAMLLQHADTAMYQAKRSGRDNAQFYSSVLTERLVARMSLDAALRGALERGEFHLVYQPQIDLASGRVVCIEALLRWTHPQRGNVPPLEFVPLAEEIGLIGRIGDWVLRTACRDAAGWPSEAVPVKLAVNLSPRQCAAPDLAQRVTAALAASGLPAGRLELELTESAILDGDTSTRTRLGALRELGVDISLDDFGTGYSSLAYLTRMPIGKIKIDRSFVGELLGGGESEAIVRAVLAMSRSLGLSVTAEGVESLEQARALRALGCDCQQGFQFSRPVTAAELPALLSRHWTLETAL